MQNKATHDQKWPQNGVHNIEKYILVSNKNNKHRTPMYCREKLCLFPYNDEK